MGLFNTFNRERAAYRSAARAADNSLRNNDQCRVHSCF